jgi:hypothetical protein
MLTAMQNQELREWFGDRLDRGINNYTGKEKKNGTATHDTKLRARDPTCSHEKETHEQANLGTKTNPPC